MEKERVFSLSVTHAPREGMTISEAWFMEQENHVSIFSLGEGTDIGNECYPRPYMYICIEGELDITAGEGIKLMPGQAALIKSGTEFALYARKSSIIIEIEGKEGWDMNLVKPDELFYLKDIVPYEEGRIVNADLINNEYMKMALMAFDAGAATSVHASPGEALLIGLDGEARIDNLGVSHIIHAGESFCFRPGILHQVTAVTPYKMIIIIDKTKKA